ncbi:ubiquitin-like domain-containing protein [Cellulomonas sp. KRMCY2]|uniref:aggregation-promoting factor C-terminal-like domain-containing protein n=1 Tax=Cellulomonas sp. KRMCY2 TaxID=1304865 RepID=UPI0004B3D35F|nr:ubiquitin-like domain-containing protein [Cellulomonas sp. KRMCY2]
MPSSSPTDRPRRRLPDRGRLAAQAVVLALVVAGTSAFAALNKTITLDVDGSVSTVNAFGRTVADVLETQGVAVADGDLVVPAPGQLVADQSVVVVRHGRDVVVEIDGAQQTIWTTALTVDEVVAELGLRAGFRASASRSAVVGRDVLRLSTVKTVHLVVDGHTVDLSTTAPTVREVLLDADVVLGEYDRVSVALDAAAVDGLMVLVTRVAGVARSETTTMPFETVHEDDATLAQGREVVSVRGAEGTRAVTYLAFEVGGVEVGRSILAEVEVTAPVNEVVRVGTFTGPDLSSVAPVEPGTSRAIGYELLLARGWDDTEWACLDALFAKESGWRVNALNSSSGAYGIPQALPGSKMASVADDWQTNPATQITWGLNYITGRYGTPCGAWAQADAKGWY